MRHKQGMRWSTAAGVSLVLTEACSIYTPPGAAAGGAGAGGTAGRGSRGKARGGGGAGGTAGSDHGGTAGEGGSSSDSGAGGSSERVEGGASDVAFETTGENDGDAPTSPPGVVTGDAAGLDAALVDGSLPADVASEG